MTNIPGLSVGSCCDFLLRYRAIRSCTFESVGQPATQNEDFPACSIFSILADSSPGAMYDLGDPERRTACASAMTPSRSSFNRGLETNFSMRISTFSPSNSETLKSSRLKYVKHPRVSAD